MRNIFSQPLWDTKIKWSSINGSLARLLFFGFLICRMQIFTIKVFWFSFVCVCVCGAYSNTYFVEFVLLCVLFFRYFSFLDRIYFPSDLITVYTGFNWLHVYADGCFYYWFKKQHLFVGSFYGFSFEKWTDNERSSAGHFGWCFYHTRSSHTHDYRCCYHKKSKWLSSE